nr:unnamed protein product [Callosobruchus analis]
MVWVAAFVVKTNHQTEIKCEVCDRDIRRGSAKVKCSNASCDVIYFIRNVSHELGKSKNWIKLSGCAKIAMRKAIHLPTLNLLLRSATFASSNKLLLGKIEQLSSNNFDIETSQNIDPPIPYSHVVSKNVEKCLENRNDLIESLVQNKTFLEDCDLKVVSVLRLKYSLNVIIY